MADDSIPPSAAKVGGDNQCPNGHTSQKIEQPGEINIPPRRWFRFRKRLSSGQWSSFAGNVAILIWLWIYLLESHDMGHLLGFGIAIIVMYAATYYFLSKLFKWKLALASCLLLVFSTAVGIFKNSSESGWKPGLPWIEITTENGLRAPSELAGGVQTGEMFNLLREHRLVINNTNPVDLRNLTARVQLPEPAVIRPVSGVNLSFKIPPAVHIVWGPEEMELRGNAGGNGAGVAVTGAVSAKSEWSLELDILPARTSIEIPFVTVPENTNSFAHLFSLAITTSKLTPHFTDTNSMDLIDYLDGSYQFQQPGSLDWQTQRVVIAILFDPTNRIMRSFRPHSGSRWNISERHGYGQ
jgi:hypothetical protein